MVRSTNSQWSGEMDSWLSQLESVFRYVAVSWPVTILGFSCGNKEIILMW